MMKTLVKDWRFPTFGTAPEIGPLKNPRSSVEFEIEIPGLPRVRLYSSGLIWVGIDRTDCDMHISSVDEWLSLTFERQSTYDDPKVFAYVFAILAPILRELSSLQETVRSAINQHLPDEIPCEV